MTHTLPELPYDKEALAPHISSTTLEFHHGKHHQAYVTNLNNLLDTEPFSSMKNLPLEELIKASHGKDSHAPIFNNAAQVWNHTFYWHCLTPKGGSKPQGELATKIEEAFDSFENFRAKFKQAAVSQFGSGWAWLVQDGGKLDILKTGNADLPMAHGKKALFTIDVWEHAYYLDFQNRRPDYVDTIFDHLANWDFVAKNLAG